MDSTDSPRGVDEDKDRRVWYLSEREYFRRSPPFPADEAARATALCVARWASGYMAFVIGTDIPSRSGPVQGDQHAIGALLDSLFAWAGKVPVAGNAPGTLGLQLYRGDELLLDHHDGTPGDLKVRLSAHEFKALQVCLEGFGLPGDLYFPEDDLRTVVEPLRWMGGVVRARASYSPLAWQHREAGDRPPPLAIPSEASRRQVFAAACERYKDAITARQAALARHPTEAMSDDREILAQITARLDLVVQQEAQALGIAAVPGGLSDATELRPALSSDSRREDEEFSRALFLRLGELREVGAEPNPDELRALEALQSLVSEIRVRSLGITLPSGTL